MIGFTHVFAGIGGVGANVVDGITSDVVKVRVNPGHYLLRTRVYRERITSFFSSLPENTILWIVTEDKPVNVEILQLMTESSPEGSTKLAYVFTPKRELVKEEKPEWADGFDTVFYDSLWEFLDERTPLAEAYEKASGVIARAITHLHKNLESQMLINVDYADFFTVVKGGNVGILRLLRRVDFDWHWGLWDRGIVVTLARDDVALKEAHSVLKRFHDLLRKKDIIWGMATENGIQSRMEILALLVKTWEDGEDDGKDKGGAV